MAKPFILKAIFPDEITLVILEYYLYDPDLTSDSKEIQAGSWRDTDDYWRGLENIPGLLSTESAMRDTLRSICLRVNVIPYQLRFHYFRVGTRWDRSLFLKLTLAEWPAGYQHVRSLALEGQREMLSTDLLQACPNLMHLRIGCLQNLWGPMIHRWHCSIPQRLFSDDETSLSEEKGTTKLHLYPKFEHIELTAEPSFWPENGDRNPGFFDALQAIVVEIVVGFTRQKRKIKLEIIKRDGAHRREESLGVFRVPQEAYQESPYRRIFEAGGKDVRSL